MESKYQGLSTDYSDLVKRLKCLQSAVKKQSDRRSQVSENRKNYQIVKDGLHLKHSTRSTKNPDTIDEKGENAQLT